MSTKRVVVKKTNKSRTDAIKASLRIKTQLEQIKNQAEQINKYDAEIRRLEDDLKASNRKVELLREERAFNKIDRHAENYGMGNRRMAELLNNEASSDMLEKRIKRLQGALNHITEVVNSAKDPSFIAYASPFTCHGTIEEKVVANVIKETLPDPPAPTKPFIGFTVQGRKYVYKEDSREYFRPTEPPYSRTSAAVWVGSSGAEFIYQMSDSHLKETVRWLISTFKQVAVKHISFEGLMREMITRGLLEFEDNA